MTILYSYTRLTHLTYCQILADILVSRTPRFGMMSNHLPNLILDVNLK